MSTSRTGSGLQIIFSFFLGLMLTAFVGVGVYTFHPPPQEDLAEELQEVGREIADVRGGRANSELGPGERIQVEELEARRSALQDEMDEAMNGWGRSTSIILILFATLLMAVSLIRATELPVISNGLLLGGLFTMVYGVGWIVASEATVSRFIVMSFALVITLGLGYARFVRGGAAPAAAAPGAPGGGASEATLQDVSQRLADVEARLDRAARGLGGDPGA